MAKKQAGVYFGRLIQSGLDSLNNSNQTPYIFLTFKVNHVSDGKGWIETKEFTRDIKIFLSDKAWPYSQRELKGLGFNGDFYNPTFNAELSEPGTRLICTIKRQDDKEYEDWSLPATGDTKDRKLPSKDTIRKLNSRWKTNDSLNKAPSSDKPKGTDSQSPFS